MRQIIACLFPVAFLVAGCGGGIEGDLDKSEETLQKEADAMSVDELQAKMDDIQEYSKKLKEEFGDGKLTEEQEAKMAKLTKVTSIYATTLMRKSMGTGAPGK